MCSNDLMTYFPDRPISETYFSDLGVLKNTTGQRRQLMREFHWKVPKPPLWYQLSTHGKKFDPPYIKTLNKDWLWISEMNTFGTPKSLFFGSYSLWFPKIAWFLNFFENFVKFSALTSSEPPDSNFSHSEKMSFCITSCTLIASKSLFFTPLDAPYYPKIKL